MIAITYVLAVWLDHSGEPPSSSSSRSPRCAWPCTPRRPGAPLRRVADVLFVARRRVRDRQPVLRAPTRSSSASCSSPADCCTSFAPFSIIRHIAFRREVDRETMLGALAAYLLFGMAFAFAYRFFGEVQRGPFFGAAGRRHDRRRPLLQLRHADHDGLRQPRAGGQPRPDHRRARGLARPALPRHRRVQARQPVAASRLAATAPTRPDGPVHGGSAFIDDAAHLALRALDAVRLGDVAP